MRESTERNQGGGGWPQMNMEVTLSSGAASARLAPSVAKVSCACTSATAVESPSEGVCQSWVAACAQRELSKCGVRRLNALLHLLTQINGHGFEISVSHY